MSATIGTQLERRVAAQLDHGRARSRRVLRVERDVLGRERRRVQLGAARRPRRDRSGSRPRCSPQRGARLGARAVDLDAAARRAAPARPTRRCARGRARRRRCPRAASMRPQFGSAPCSAQRTRMSSPIARTAVRASPSSARAGDGVVGEARRRPRRRRPSGARRRAARPSSAAPSASASAPLAVTPPAPFASTTSVSFVDSEPSTETRLSEASAALRSSSASTAGSTIGVGRGGHDRRRDVGADHPGALAHHADAHLAAAQRARRACSSSPTRRWCGSHRRRRRRPPPRARPRPARCRARSPPSAAACRSRRSSRRPPRPARSRALRGRAAIARASCHAAGAGAGVGVAGVDDDGARAARRPGARARARPARPRGGCA